MKSLAVLMLAACMSYASIAQNMRITNESHPYQVLVADSVTDVIYSRSIKEFDFIKPNQILNVHNELVLVHFSGEIIRFKSGFLHLKEISRKLAISGYFERPIISDPSNYQNGSISKKKRIEGSSNLNTPLGTLTFKSPSTFYIQDLRLDQNDNMYFSWSSDERIPYNRRVYRLTINDQNDNLLYSKIVTKNYQQVPSSILKTTDNFFMAKLELVGNEQKFSTPYSPFKYRIVSKSAHEFLVNAFQHYYEGNYEYSQTLFKKSVLLSNQDKNIIKIYQDFNLKKYSSVTAYPSKIN